MTTQRDRQGLIDIARQSADHTPMAEALATQLELLMLELDDVRDEYEFEREERGKLANESRHWQIENQRLIERAEKAEAQLAEWTSKGVTHWVPIQEPPEEPQQAAAENPKSPDGTRTCYGCRHSYRVVDTGRLMCARYEREPEAELGCIHFALGTAEFQARKRTSDEGALY